MEEKSSRYVQVELPSWIQEKIDRDNKIWEEKAKKEAAAAARQKERNRSIKIAKLREELEDREIEDFSFE